MSEPPVLIERDAGVLIVTARPTAPLPVLRDDFVQTFVKAVLSGYAIGCGADYALGSLASTAGQPRILSAPLFQNTILRSRSVTTIASRALSRKPWSI